MIMGRYFRPFGYLDMSDADRFKVKVFWWAVVFLGWQYAPVLVNPLIPTPQDVWDALGHLYQRGLLVEIWVSASVVLTASFAIALPIGLVLSYLHLIGWFRYPVALLASFRNAPPLVFYTALLFLQYGGRHLKVATMAFIILTFFLSARIYAAQPREEIEHGICMRMTPWQILWHRPIMGKMHIALTDFVPCVGMGWAMLSMVEGLSRSEGGLGDLLIQQDKIIGLAGIFAIAVVGVLLGTLITWALRAGIRWRYAYAAQVAIAN